MHLSDLVFTGFNKRIAAAHRDSGQLLWQWKARPCRNTPCHRRGGTAMLCAYQGP
jgi:hypothetical protein